MPKYSGAISDATKFDSAFFGVSPAMLKFLDTKACLLLERGFEAIIDAGVSPKSLHGTNTGVFLGCCISENHQDDNIKDKSILA
jgi:fatty acid synthase